MILIGQFDSPFVRRVGVALTLYGIPFEHRPWSVWADAERLAKVNPLRRVPTLVLDDGETLIESYAILDALDEMVGPDRALIAAGGPERRRALRLCGLATGLADKAVILVYEGLLHPAPSQAWIERCRAQIAGVLDVLEDERRGAAGPWFTGDRIGHADIAAACAIGFAREAHPGLIPPARWPALTAHCAACEALDAFRAIRQPFSVAIAGQG